MKHPEQNQYGISVNNAISIFATYGSILCWFAIITAVLFNWFQKWRDYRKPKAE